MRRRAALLASLAGAPRVLFGLDYDGTLVPHVRTPRRARPTRQLLALIARLAACGEVAVISGRPRRDLEAFFGRLPVTLVAEHGHWLRLRGGRRWRALVHPRLAWKPPVRRLLARWTRRHPGAWLEEKGASLSWHYRMTDIGAAEARALALSLERATAGLPVRVLPGAKVLEVRARGIDKGRALRAVRRALGPFDVELLAGDDRTDEDMLGAARPWSHTIKVGAGPTRAREHVQGSAELLGILAEAAERRRRSCTDLAPG